MHYVVVYSSIARDYIIIQTQFSDDVKRKICLDIENMMILIDDRIVNKLNFEIKNIKSINLRKVKNQLISKYVNYDIIIDNEKLIVQSYVVEKFFVDVLLNMNIIKNYNVDIFIFKNRICIKNSEISMTYDRIEKIIINHIVIENIEQNIIQNDSVSNFVFRRNHDHHDIEKIQQIDQLKVSNYKKCEKHEFEKFQSIYDSKTKFAFVEHYVDRQISNISLMILIKKNNFYTCYRCFRIFRFKNDLHEHFRCIHLNHRRCRRFIERIFSVETNRRLNQF